MVYLENAEACVGTQKPDLASTDPSFPHGDKELGMGRIPSGVLIWSLKRYTRDIN
jgi:hypothetical protein